MLGTVISAPVRDMVPRETSQVASSEKKEQDLVPRQEMERELAKSESAPPPQVRQPNINPDIISGNDNDNQER